MKKPTKESFASDLKQLGITKIPINIWDDYYDDGYVPKGAKQVTYAYVESRALSGDLKQAILDCVRESIVPLVSPKVRLKITLDSEFMPKLQLTNLTHLERNRIVKLLRKKKLSFDGVRVDVYSES